MMGEGAQGMAVLSRKNGTRNGQLTSQEVSELCDRGSAASLLLSLTSRPMKALIASHQHPSA